jgi:arylsulfatase
MYCADNGASGEGSPNGSVNEYKFFNAYPDDIKDNLAMMNKLGSPDTYNHYPTGWAVAFSTPYKMFKRYSGYSGGTCDPLIVSWPARIKAHGELRSQYYHCTRTLYPQSWKPAACKCRMWWMALNSNRSPAVYDGVKF